MWRRRNRMRILPDAKSSFGNLDLGPNTPAGNETRRARRIEEVDRNRIVDDAAQAGGRHRPPVSAERGPLTPQVKPNTSLKTARSKRCS